MTEIVCIKTAQGAFIPATEEDAEKARRFKVGECTKFDAAQMRNGRFFRKWWLLAKVAFDAASETMPGAEYKGRRVLPDFGRFRKDLTIMAGFYRPVFNARGEMRLEPESLKWGSMTEERFEQLYQASINAILQKVLPDGRYTEDELRRVVDRVLEFA